MIDRHWLEEQHVQNNLTQSQIGEMLGVSGSTVGIWLKKYGVSKESPYTTGNHVHLTPNTLQFIEGNLLGDGALDAPSKISARYLHGSKFRSFLSNYLRPKLLKYGFKPSGQIYKDERTYYFVTKAYRELADLWQKWYQPSTKKGRRFEKHVPDDLILTPSVLREWHIGDGCLMRDSQRKNHSVRAVRLSTNGFTLPEVELLAEKLTDIGIQSTVRLQKNYSRPVGWVIFLTGLKSIIPFFDTIGSCPLELIPIYGYKWPLPDELHNHAIKLSEDDARSIRQSQMPVNDLAAKYHVCRTTIWLVKHKHGRYNNTRR